MRIRDLIVSMSRALHVYYVHYDEHRTRGLQIIL